MLVFTGSIWFLRLPSSLASESGRQGYWILGFQGTGSAWFLQELDFGFGFSRNWSDLASQELDLVGSSGYWILSFSLVADTKKHHQRAEKNRTLCY
jgi:hypothetical protein